MNCYHRHLLGSLWERLPRGSRNLPAPRDKMHWAPEIKPVADGAGQRCSFCSGFWTDSIPKTPALFQRLGLPGRHHRHPKGPARPSPGTSQTAISFKEGLLPPPWGTAALNHVPLPPLWSKESRGAAPGLQPLDHPWIVSYCQGLPCQSLFLHEEWLFLNGLLEPMALQCLCSTST